MKVNPQSLAKNMNGTVNRYWLTDLECDMLDALEAIAGGEGLEPAVYAKQAIARAVVYAKKRGAH